MHFLSEVVCSLGSSKRKAFIRENCLQMQWEEPNQYKCPETLKAKNN